MAKVSKPENISELGTVDISTLKNLVARTSEQVWNLENERKENAFDVFHHTRHIIFRFIEGMRDHRQFLLESDLGYLAGTASARDEQSGYKYDFQNPAFPKAMLARLSAGAVIDRHVDGAGSNLHTHKIHIPLQTNEKAIMFINDEPFHLREGYVYEVNNIVPHAVENLGTEDRIHLIFEVFDQEEKVAA